MTVGKQVSFSVDYEALSEQLKARREELLKEESDKAYQTTFITVDSDKRVTSEPPLAAPNLYKIELLLDSMDNPFVRLTWQSAKYDIESKKVIGFNIFRKRIIENYRLSETSSTEIKEKTQNFSLQGVEYLSRNIKSFGKFSQEKKSKNIIADNLLPQISANNNSSLAVPPTAESVASSLGTSFVKKLGASNFFNVNAAIPNSKSQKKVATERFQKIAHVSYSSFLAKEKLKKVFVEDRNVVEMSYDDKVVSYGREYDYYVVPVTSEVSSDKIQSNTVRIFVFDRTPISAPEVTARQRNESEVVMAITSRPENLVNRVVIFRKSEFEVAYTPYGEATNVAERLQAVDKYVDYGTRYFYRVFAKNIFNTVSPPTEVDIYSSVQAITPQTRSNNLKVPVLHAEQQDVSFNIKLTVSPNDFSVSYYKIDRRDLTINEKVFLVPSATNTKYGGAGWKNSGIFFVNKVKRQASDFSGSISSILNTKTVLDEIIFVDDTVEYDHIYQYRITGYDLFGNQSPSAFSTVRVSSKKTLKSPINLRTETLRGYPLRIKLSWDDNSAGSNIPEEKKMFLIQRRRSNQIRYESFPLTKNSFIIDEEQTLDFVPFSQEKVSEQDIIEASQNLSKDPKRKTLSRADGVPDFFDVNSRYYYRVKVVEAVQTIGNQVKLGSEESNFTTEFGVVTLPDLSDPKNFSIFVQNRTASPAIAKLSWDYDSDKSVPDHILIERKYDTPEDSFIVIGREYLGKEFLDKGLELGSSYIYRIKSIDLAGRESAFVEQRISI